MVRFRLEIPSAIVDAILAHAQSVSPNECCGFLAGNVEAGVGHVSHHVPLTNELASPTEYAVPVKELLRAAKEMRSSGVGELAVYHSHPTSAPVPSRRDIERNGYGDAVIHVIIGLTGNAPDVRAWWLTAAGVVPAEWVRV